MSTPDTSIPEQVAALLAAHHAARSNERRTVAAPFTGLTQDMVDGMDDVLDALEARRAAS